MSSPTQQENVMCMDDFANRPLWGSPTERVMEEFKISTGPMPSELIAALAVVKRACAAVNRKRAANDHANECPVDVLAPAVNVAASVGLAHNLLPALIALRIELMAKVAPSSSNARAASVDHEIKAHVAQLAQACHALQSSLPAVHRLALSTEPGTAASDFGWLVARSLTEALDLPFESAAKPGIHAHASPETLIGLHAQLKSTATCLTKIAGDMRALLTPDDDPSQCDALTMVCCQVMDNDAAMAAGTVSIAHQLLQSIRLLTDATTVFTEYFVRGMPVNRERISHGLARSLMLVSSRTPQVA